MKKFIALGSILVLTIIGACTAHADSKKETNQEIPNVLLNNDKVKDSDTLIKIPGGVYVHGKVTITENNKEIATLDSDNNLDAKTLKNLKMREDINIVEAPTLKREDGSAPPIYGMKLAQDAYAAGVWDVNYGGIHYTPYAYETTNPSVDLLYWISKRDSMYIGGSEVWNNPTHGTVVNPGEGTYINPPYNSSAAWTYAPFVAGASWYVGNIWA